MHSVAENTTFLLKLSSLIRVGNKVFRFMVLACIILIGYSCQGPISTDYECQCSQPLDTLKLFIEEAGEYQFYKHREKQRVELHYLGGSALDQVVLYFNKTGIYGAQELEPWKFSKYQNTKISIDLCEDCFNLPQRVTANGDGINDHFLPPENYCSIQLDVEGELGVPVDTEVDNWERIYPDGRYYYVCEIKSLEGEIYVQNGSFDLSH